MPKSHLAFAVRASQPPPPPLLGGGGASKSAANGATIGGKKRKADHNAAAAAAAAAALSSPQLAPGSGGVSGHEMPKKKQNKAVLPTTSMEDSPVKKKKKKGVDDVESQPSPPPPQQQQQQKQQQKQQPKSSAGGCASSADVGKEASQVLLLLGVPASLSEFALQRMFESCAPLQVRLLKDWSSGAKRGAASLALTSAGAVKRALEVGRAAGGGDGGGRIRVCDVARSADQEGGFGSTVSGEMRASIERLHAKVAGAASLEAAELAAVRHLLLTVATEEAAKAAVDEFVALTRSGKPRNPGQLLLAALLRQRRLVGGDVWLGRVRGLPLPAAPAARLRQILDELDWSAMPADGKLRGNMADNSFKLGLSTRAWSKQNGPYVPFAFKPATGVWDAASVTRKHKELWEAASALIAAVDPSYPWTSVQFNRNFRGSRHRDDKDASYQVATAFGEYTGGELRVHGQEGVTDVDTRGRFVRFDGRFEHEVLPYEGGPRYSVIFFMLAPPWSVDPSSLEG